MLFFDKKPASDRPWTETSWIYDLRTNKHFTLKTNPIEFEDLQDFITCCNPKNRHQRVESDRFKAFTHDELVKRDKASLDIFWLEDESWKTRRTSPIPKSSQRRLWRARRLRWKSSGRYIRC